jgi:hypothetical protein
MTRRRSLSIMLAALLLSGAPGSVVVLATEGDGSEGDMTRSEALSAVVPVQIPAWLVTYMKSATGGAIQACTVISITNQSATRSCPTSVDFFFGSGDLACTTTVTIEPGQTWEHCSRNITPGIVFCNASCQPPLTNVEGKAIVRTTEGCRPKLAVFPRVYYTNSVDGAVQAIAAVNLVRINKANAGD